MTTEIWQMRDERCGATVGPWPLCVRLYILLLIVGASEIDWIIVGATERDHGMLVRWWKAKSVGCLFYLGHERVSISSPNAFCSLFRLFSIFSNYCKMREN